MDSFPQYSHVKEQVKWNQDCGSEVVGVAEWLLSESMLISMGIFQSRKGFVYDLIISNSQLSSKPAAHFILAFCTNMCTSLNTRWQILLLT